MPWYAAHIIEYLRYLDNSQDEYFVNENVILIKSDDSEKAYIEAKKIGLKNETDTEIGPDHRLARWTFSGVRKIVECQDNDAAGLKQPEIFLPHQGTEITYTSLLVNTKEDLEMLSKGGAVKVELEDISPLTEDEISELLSPIDRNQIN